MQLTLIAAIVTAIVGVAFAMQNNVPVTVNLLAWRCDSSLAMVLLLALALGAIADLEAQLPASAEGAKPPTLVGLKQLIVGRGGDPTA